MRKTMSLKEFEEFLARRGCSLNDWSHSERVAALDLLANSEDARSLLAAAKGRPHRITAASGAEPRQI